MIPKVKIISKDSIKPSVWDGGKTFEYLIYPKDSIYAERNFLFRISSASITKTPSHFTRFLGFKRYLVMLDNVLEIDRNNKKEFYTESDIFKFPSNDEIVSYSLGNDFNLMVADSVAFSSVELSNELKNSTSDFVFVFAKKPTSLQLNNQEITLKSNDLLCLENSGKDTITISSNGKVLFISVQL